MLSILLSYAVALGIGLLGRSFGWLTMDGAIAAAVVGGSVFAFAGWQGALILMLFFLSSSLLSRLNRSARRDRNDSGKVNARNARQVVANGLVASLAAMWSVIAGVGEGPGLIAPRIALAGAFAAATADTWATEIGLWAKGIPRSALTARLLKPGESGGMTAFGTFGGLVGAALIGTAAAWVWDDFGIAHAMAVEVAGFAGMWLDSLLGASVQYKAYCPTCSAVVEERRHVHPVERRRGWSVIDNDAVNLLATLAGAVLAVVAL